MCVSGEGVARGGGVGLATASPGSVEFVAAASLRVVTRLRLPPRPVAPKTVLATSPDPKGACMAPETTELLEPAPSYRLAIKDRLQHRIVLA